MKVAIITSIFTPYRKGGAEVVVQQRITEYQAAGHEVVVLTAGPWRGWQSLSPQQSVIEGVTVYRWYPLNIFSILTIDHQPSWWRALWHLIDMFNLHSAWLIRRILRQERPDLVETHTVKGIGYTSWRAAQAGGRKTVQVLHDVQLVVPSGLLLVGQEAVLGRWWIRLYASICRWFVGKPTEVVSPSRWLLRFYQQRQFFRGSQAVVQPGFGVQLPQQVLLPVQVDGPLRLLFVGQLAAHKGALWLIEVLHASSLDWQLTVIGDGPQQQQLQQRVAADARITAIGRQSLAEVKQAIDHADAVVVPSLCYENAPTISPLSLQQAMPVVAAAVGGIPEFITEGKTGLLFTAGDQQACVAALQQLFAN